MEKRTVRLLVSIVLAACLLPLPAFASEPMAPEAAPNSALVQTAPVGAPVSEGGGTPARYIVFATQPDGSVRAVFSKRVRMQIRGGQSYAGLRPTGNDADLVRVRVEDARQAVIFEDTVEIPKWIRGEFHGKVPDASGEFAIDSHILPDRAPAFVVRVPDIAGTTLALDSVAFAPSTRLDLDALDANFAVTITACRHRNGAPSGWNNGAPANRLDLLIMGDGYTAASSRNSSRRAQLATGSS